MSLQEKAAEIAKKYEHLSMRDKIGIIAQAFGCTSGKIETSPCYGKWRGTSDISIKFDNGVTLPIGNEITPKAKTVKVQNEYSSVDAYHPTSAESEPAEEQAPKMSKQLSGFSAPPSVKTGGNPTIRDLAADLKNPDKDRSPTPDTFVISFSLSLQRFCQNIKSFEVSGFASVFPALTQTHLVQIQQEIDSVHTILNNFLTKLKGN